MSKFVAAWCCLMLAAAPPAIAQATGAGGKTVPASKKTPDEEQKELAAKFFQCTAKAQDKDLKPGTREFDRFMTDCANK